MIQSISIKDMTLIIQNDDKKVKLKLKEDPYGNLYVEREDVEWAFEELGISENKYKEIWKSGYDEGFSNALEQCD